MNSPAVLVSTGAFVGRANGFDETVIADRWREFDCDGFELMVIEPWYGRYAEVKSHLRAAGFAPKTIHLEKKIGILLAENTEESRAEACRHFAENMNLAEDMGASLAVLHFWGGPCSDGAVKQSLPYLNSFYEMADKKGIVLTVENIPCLYSDPLQIWESIADAVPCTRFIFDTRFGSFHNQTDAIIHSPLWSRVLHMHISDFDGAPMEWEKIRAILHPGKGHIDFASLFQTIPSFPSAMAVESPVLDADGIVNVEKMNASVGFLRSLLQSRMAKEE